MPELPDVEVFKQYLQSTALNQKIRRVRGVDENMLGDVTRAKLKSVLEKRGLVAADRIGKYLFSKTDRGDWLVLHFGMTGFLKYYKNEEEKPRHARMLLDFENGRHLAFDCRRKLGLIDIASDPQEFAAKKGLGIDALDKELDFKRFKELVAGGASAIKPALMNQECLSGIGNIYADEILFQAGVDPRKKVTELSEVQLRRIFGKLKTVLPKAIRARADAERMPRTFLLPHREGDGICPVCGKALGRTKISGRTTYFCENEQK